MIDETQASETRASKNQPDETRATPGLRVADFDFHLPRELIAQQPPAERGQSRMLVLDRSSGAVRDDRFAELSNLLNPGDLLVLNDSRVIPARLYARRSTIRDREPANALIEVLLTEPAEGDKRADVEPGAPSMRRTGGPANPSSRGGAWVGNLETQRLPENSWHALVKPGRKVAIGERLEFLSKDGSIELTAEVLDRGEFGDRLLRFDPVPGIDPVEAFFAVLDRIGHMPLPPYIRRDDASEDRERYQTVFSRQQGSVAAPTAGLHFTPHILEALTAKGIEIANVTLHVGLGTFAPLRVERVEQVHLHRERYSISATTADAINRTIREGRRIVAVGTTVVRTLEAAAASAAGELTPHSGETEIFISPGYKFRVVSALLTNFHLPKSSLLMLVSAFAGRENVLAAYHHAVQQNYRFFSYGDCMFIA
jgi:S-adenosylmethionine:tRNA ribosyltransferase-isomerase